MFPLHPEIATTAENTSPTQCIFPSASLNVSKTTVRACTKPDMWHYQTLEAKRCYKRTGSSHDGVNGQIHQDSAENKFQIISGIRKWRFKTKYQHTFSPLLLQDLRYHQEVTTVTVACQILSWQTPWPNSHLQWGCQRTTGREKTYMILDATKELA